ncbi:MAG: hypothetical protein ACFCU5_02735 [Pleurocapsa sp.]
MNRVGEIERITQNRVVKLFQQQLQYRYLGNWQDRENNSNIEEGILREYLTQQGYSLTSINKALYFIVFDKGIKKSVVPINILGLKPLRNI